MGRSLANAFKPKKSKFNILPEENKLENELSRYLRIFNISPGQDGFIWQNPGFEISSVMKQKMIESLINELKSYYEKFKASGMNWEDYVDSLNNNTSEEDFDQGKSNIQFSIHSPNVSEEEQANSDLMNELFDLLSMYRERYILNYERTGFRNDFKLDNLTYLDRKNRYNILGSYYDYGKTTEEDLQELLKKRRNELQEKKNEKEIFQQMEEKERNLNISNPTEYCDNILWGEQNINRSCDLNAIPEDEKILIPNGGRRQTVFGFSICIDNYQKCREKFLIKPMMWNPDIKNYDHLKWNILLNRIFTKCISLTDGLIRFIINEPNEKTKYLPKMNWNINDSIRSFNDSIIEFIGILTINIQSNNLHKLIYFIYIVNPNQHINQSMGRYVNFLLYDIYGNQVNWGELFKITNVTFDEFFLFIAGYQKMNIVEYLPFSNNHQRNRRMYFLYNDDNNIDSLYPKFQELINSKELKNITEEVRNEMQNLTGYVIKGTELQTKIENTRKKISLYLSKLRGQIREQPNRNFSENNKFTNLRNLLEQTIKLKKLSKINHNNVNLNNSIDEIIQKFNRIERNHIGGGNKYQLKLSNKITDYFNEKITGKYLDINNTNYYFLYWCLSKKKINLNEYFNKYNLFVYIYSYYYNWNKNNKKKKIISIDLKYISKSKKYYDILKTKNIDIFLNEIIINFNLLNRKKKILVINFPEKKKINNTVNIFQIPKSIDFFNFNKYKYINKKNNINESNLFYQNYLDLRLITNFQEKYDLIMNFATNKRLEIDMFYFDHNNIQLYFLSFLYSLFRLNKNGSMLMYMNITNKPIADLVLIGKMLFKEVNLYKPEAFAFYKNTGNYVIFKNFKGIIPKELINIAEQLLKNDPTSSNFNIKDPKIRKKYYITKKIPKNWKYKYITQFLNIPITDKRYDFIRKYNNNEELKKMVMLNEVIYNLENNIIPDNKEEQLIHSVLYAKKYNLEIIDMDKGKFNSDLGKLILKDLYTKHKPIKINFSILKKIHKEYKIDIDAEIKELNRKIYMSKLSLESRNIPEFLLENNRVLFYNPKSKIKLKNLNEYIQNNYTKYKVSNSWLSLQEILSTFKTIIPKKNKKFKVFYLNKCNGNDIKSICYYIKKNKISQKCFEWRAHSYNRILYKNNNKKNDLFEKYKENFDLGLSNIGDITKFKFIEHYKEKCKNIKLLLGTANKYCVIKNIPLKKLKLAEIIFIFNNLPKNGNFILYFDINYNDSLFINLIYLMFKSFKQLYLYNSLQNLYSSEFYIIGINYTQVKTIYLKKMKSILNKYDDEKLQEKIIKSKYPIEFINQIHKSFEEFTNNYIFNINKQLYYQDNVEYIPKEHYKELKKINNVNNIDWAKKYL